MYTYSLPKHLIFLGNGVYQSPEVTSIDIDLAGRGFMYVCVVFACGFAAAAASFFFFSSYGV